MPDAVESLSFRFNDLLLDMPAGVLLRVHPDGQMTREPVGRRAFRILCLLVERRGAIVTRQEIMDAVWPDAVVEENNLSVQLSNLRRALDTDRNEGSCIQTLPGRGYRFLPAVTASGGRLSEQAVSLAIAGHSTLLGDDARQEADAREARVVILRDPPLLGDNDADNVADAEPISNPGRSCAVCPAPGSGATHAGTAGAEPAPGAPPAATGAPDPRADAGTPDSRVAARVPCGRRTVASRLNLSFPGLAWIAAACVLTGGVLVMAAWYATHSPAPRLLADSTTVAMATQPPREPAAEPPGELTVVQPAAPSPPLPAAVTPAAAPVEPTARMAPGAERPRLSVVVLPFDKLGDGVDDTTVNALTEDLTTAITRGHAGQVTVRHAAVTYNGKPIDIRRIGEELGVRFAIAGNVRRIGATLRVSVRLVSAETGSHLWAEDFDAASEAGGYTVEDIVRHMTLALVFKLLDAESTRIARENPGSTDAADAHLRARAALYVRPPHPQTQDQVIAMLERALALDPNVAVGWAGLVEALLNSIDIWTDDPTAPAKIRRAEQAVIRAELLGPEERLVMGVRVPVLMMLGRCAEVPAAAQRVSAAHPSLAAPSMILGLCLMRDGQAAEALPHFEQSIRVNPRNPSVFIRYRVMGYALLFLDRYEEAIAWFQKALVTHPGDSARSQGNLHAAIAAAQALAGNMAGARDSAAEAGRLWPTLTARSYFPIKVFSPVAATQVARVRDGLRLAGIRDHADEDADPGLPEDDVLHTSYDAPTPVAAPGVRTIRTADLSALIEQRRPLVLDASNPWGPSVPGAIVLPGVGVGGSLTDEVQERLRQKMVKLTGGDPSMPVVTVGWNAERYQGRNLALRLVALGYTDVSWYRGGREAWLAAGLPTAEVVSRDW